jgi:single-strand DNA-binding protein
VVDQTEWHNIEMWDDLAKLAEKYVKKGKLLYVEGKIRTNKWTDRETNQERQNKFIRATAMNFLGTSRDNDNNDGGGSSYNKGDDNGGGNNQSNNNYNNNNNSSSNAPANDPAPAPEPMPDDDLPF